MTDAATKAACSGCHKIDDKGRMTRISYIRTTPEGWQEIIKRMVRNNGLVIDPVQARSIVKRVGSTADPKVALHQMYKSIYAREPDADEVRLGLQFIERSSQLPRASNDH